MSIALVGDNWWKSACESAEEPFIVLPPAGKDEGNPYAADVAARSEVGPKWLDQLAGGDVDLLLDNGGTGLTFVPSLSNSGSTRLMHEAAGLPLASHFIDPLVTASQGVPWSALWNCLASKLWFKFMWDKPQTEELVQFGVPNVHHVPMAAPDRAYNTRPLDATHPERSVSFVGGQNTGCFYPGARVLPEKLLAGTLAMGVRADLPDLPFFRIYFDLYRLAEPPLQTDSLATRIDKASDYFSAKLFYNASLCIKQRDRFVIFLKRRLGDMFTLIGDRWHTAYGLTTEPKLPTTDAYFEHFRKTAINLNLVNGNSDSGLNMRHFEITAAGGFMLCYHSADIDEFFEVGTECETFTDEQDLLKKIQFYLEHPKKRMEIAQAGQRRTLKEHLYSHRLKTIRTIVRQAQTGENQPNARRPLASVAP